MAHKEKESRPVRSVGALVPTGGSVAALDPSTVFGPPLLIQGEDGEAHELLQRGISAAVKPVDVIERIWVRDIVDLSWECLRIRRLKTALLNRAMIKGLDEVLRPKLGYEQASVLAGAWAAREKEALEEVDAHLASMGTTLEAAAAIGFQNNIGSIERMDRLIASAEMRRNSALREIERHRQSFGKALQQASDDVVEGEFEDVVPEHGARKDAA